MHEHSNVLPLIGDIANSYRAEDLERSCEGLLTIRETLLNLAVGLGPVGQPEMARKLTEAAEVLMDMVEATQALRTNPEMWPEIQARVRLAFFGEAQSSEAKG